MLGRIKNKCGFTILDSVLSMILLSVGLMGGMTVLQNALLHSVQGDRNMIATQLAQEKMDGILADNTFLGYDYVADESHYPEEDMMGSYAGFTRSVTIIEVDTNDLTTPAPGSGLNKIIVQVSWGEQSDDVFTMNTLVAQMN